MIKKLLLAVGVAILTMVLFMVLAFIAYVGYSVFANQNAEQQAKTLCSKIQSGSELQSVFALAASSKDKNRRLSYQDKHRFIFQGAIFYSSECVVESSNGKVVSARIVINKD